MMFSFLLYDAKSFRAVNNGHAKINTLLVFGRMDNDCWLEQTIFGGIRAISLSVLLELDMKINPRFLDSNIYRYSVDIPSRFSDIDLQNHLNNTRIGEFYQEGRVRFFNQLVKDKNLQRPEGMRVLVAHIAIDYVAEVNYPRTVTMKLGIAGLGRSSITLQMALFSGERCAGLAKVVVVIADAKGSMPIPEPWRAVLNDYLLPLDV
jgi:acyl-CoA thioester hydrolase